MTRCRELDNQGGKDAAPGLCARWPADRRRTQHGAALVPARGAQRTGLIPLYGRFGSAALHPPLMRPDESHRPLNAATRRTDNRRALTAVTDAPTRRSESAFCAARQDVGTGPLSPSVTGKADWGTAGGIGRCLLCDGQIRGSDERARPCQSSLPDVLPSGNSGLCTEGVASRSASEIGLIRSSIYRDRTTDPLPFRSQNRGKTGASKPRCPYVRTLTCGFTRS
jgi:hypothetical protein